MAGTPRRVHDPLGEQIVADTESSPDFDNVAVGHARRNFEPLRISFMSAIDCVLRERLSKVTEIPVRAGRKRRRQVSSSVHLC